MQGVKRLSRAVMVVTSEILTVTLAGGLILIDQCADPFSVEAVRASMRSPSTHRVTVSDEAYSMVSQPFLSGGRATRCRPHHTHSITHVAWNVKRPARAVPQCSARSPRPSPPPHAARSR